MLEELKEQVFKGNLELVERGLVMLTWGNASGIDRDKGLVVIKPSGVPYNRMTADDMVVVTVSGDVIEGKYKPSVDLATHLALYEGFQEIGGVVHTHSHYATCFAQACMSIECFGTTHADYFWKEVPVTECLTESEVSLGYEENIGASIIRKFNELGRKGMETPGALAANHGPFTWGETVEKAVENAEVLEEVAKMAMSTVMLAGAGKMPGYLMSKHFWRKHGEKAYYGQHKG